MIFGCLIKKKFWDSAGFAAGQLRTSKQKTSFSCQHGLDVHSENGDGGSDADK